LPTGNVTFPAGSNATQLTTIPVQGDTTVESNEDFTVTLTSVTNATVTTATATGTIVNDDFIPTVAIAATDANKSEGSAGTNNFTFTATRTGDITNVSSLSYVVSGAAVNGTDFVGGTLPTGTVTFPAGSNATQTILIPVQGDTAVESNEDFTVTLTSVTNATVTTATATGTIVNDDFIPTVAITATDTIAGETGLDFGTFRFTRSIVTASPLDIIYEIATGAGQATNGIDYRTIPTTIQIPANQASVDLLVAPLADLLSEANETATLNLSANVAYTLDASANATVTIQDFVFGVANAHGSGVISRSTFNGGNLILGSNGTNSIVGNASADTIAAFAGDDVVYALGGNDSIDGGFGDDEINGGLGSDTLLGNIGNDTLIGTDFSSLGANEIDILIGGAGADRFILGARRFNGTPGFDFYVGNGNNDFARIADFELLDTIQLNTAPSSVANVVAPFPGVGIFVAGDLVAVVQGADATIANVTNQFRF
jgi:Ca2+-binding RTX toxin-like protein